MYMNKVSELHLQYSKTCLKRPLKKNTKIGFQYRVSLNAGQKYSAILSTFFKLPFSIKTFVLSIFEWPLRTGFTVQHNSRLSLNAGQKYCRLLQVEHSSILSTFIKLPFSIKIFVYF